MDLALSVVTSLRLGSCMLKLCLDESKLWHNKANSGVCRVSCLLSLVVDGCGAPFQKEHQISSFLNVNPHVNLNGPDGWKMHSLFTLSSVRKYSGHYVQVQAQLPNSYIRLPELFNARSSVGL